MDKLGTLGHRELGQLKSLLSGERLPTEAQINILNLLRSKLPDFLSQLTPDLTEKDRKDNSKIINYLAKNTNKSKILLKKKLYLSSTQQIELIKELEKPASTTEAGGQPEGQPAGQETQPAGAIGSSGAMPSMPSINMPSTPSMPRIYNVPHAESGMAGGQGTGSATTKKIDRLKAEQMQTYGQGTAATNKGLQNTTVSGMKGGTGQGTAASSKSFAPTTSPRFNFSNFRSKVGGGIAGAARTGLERANPFLKRGGNALVRGLTNIANPGGMQGIGGGSRSVLGRIGRFGRGGGSRASSLVKSAKKRTWLVFLMGILGLMFLTGFTAFSGTPPTGEAVPISSIIPPITPSDISSCRFTRGDRSPKEASFKSPLLLNYIQEASGLTKIPAAVLAAFIRVESPSTVDFTDEQIKGYQCIETDPGKNVSDTGALGIMQLQPEGTKGNDSAALAAGAKLIGKEYSQLTKADYCDVRKSIIMGAGFILTKLSYKGMETSPPLPKGIYPVYGDGTKWDSSWTNDNQAISKLVNGYYGCLQYPSCFTGPYNYATDVSTSIQNCKATTVPGTIPPPPPPLDGNYKKWLKDFGVNINDGFVDDVYKWAYDVLSTTPATAPKFSGLLGISSTSSVEIKPICNHVSYTSGRTIFLRNQGRFCFSMPGDPEGPTSEVNLFKHTLIHELGHVVYNTNRTDYNAKIIQARTQDNGFLTKYAADSASSLLLTCGVGDDNGNRADEDFAESVSYFINSGIFTQNYGCGIWSEELGVNPFDIQTNGQKKYAAHYQFMTELLK